MTAELTELKANLAHSQQREKKSGSLVQELTAMVKEQKSRISDLIKAKRDAVTDLKVHQRDTNTKGRFFFCNTLGKRRANYLIQV